MAEILIVEDDENIARMIEATLSMVGYRCDGCEDGSEAVRRLSLIHICSPEPGPQEYELANVAYAGIKAEYGDPEPLAVQDGNEHFQSLERLEELKEGPSVSRCVDSWADTGHKGMEAVLSAELIPNSMLSGPEDGSTFILSLWFRWKPKLP